MYTLEELRADVKDQGWVVLKIDGGRGGVDFGYSVGLYEFCGHPELVVFGLDDETMQELINDVGERVEDGNNFADGAVSAEFLEGYSVTFRAVPQHQMLRHFAWLHDYYGREDVPVLQVVYPDKKRRWPWNAGVGEGFKKEQPVLAELLPPPPDATSAPSSAE